VRDTAAELLNLYARRAAREGHAHRFSAHDYEAFATSFGFEETADQRAAIHAVIQDMVSPQADGPPGVRRRGLRQDRGGLRAAFVAVMAASRWRSWRPPRCWPSSTTRP
jgi:transcription-repair coupling factor (superfamily II helicase)